MTKLGTWKIACAVFVLCAGTAIGSEAQIFQTLVEFDGNDGAVPYGGVVQGVNGNFYGTTSGDGTNYYGTIFEVTPAGHLIILYSFCSQPNCTDGASPASGLAQAGNGNFYGTTSIRGANDEGTVFEITAAGRLTTLYSFCSQTNCTDGATPSAGLVQASNGNFYGTTLVGGTNAAGTVFEISPAGKLTTLYSFCSKPSCADGERPQAGLVQAENGKLYGTTYTGGVHGAGTIFEVVPAGGLTTVYNFCSRPNCTDGAYPASGVVQATNGKLYGTTTVGGVNCLGSGGCGTIFEVAPTGKVTTRYSFCSKPNCSDGQIPGSGLVQATDGNLYGTTANGGINCLPGVNCGTIFEINPSGKLTTLYNFCSQPNCSDGDQPWATLLQATNGAFYGTTLGSSHTGLGDGTVYSLSTGLGPFVTFVRPAGKVGQTGGVLGQGFTGTTSVSLNGTSASFTVKSDTLILATVPSGATTGYVTVTTPTGTLTSNVPFHVIP
jgi:uncharacterized repeat protein (TIGR03803 family)